MPSIYDKAADGVCENWRLILADANTVDQPAELDHCQALNNVPVPGTVAAALEAAGQLIAKILIHYTIRMPGIFTLSKNRHNWQSWFLKG